MTTNFRGWLWGLMLCVVAGPAVASPQGGFFEEIRYEGQCWIDDDPNFDAGQIAGGRVYGRTTLELRQECQFAARQAHGENGSSDVTDIKPVSAAGQGVEADCWIDDDPDFDFGQTSGGKLTGRSSYDVRRECAFIARNRYGEQGSSGIQNVRLVPMPAGGLYQARCWVDDDPDFDMGQKDGGLVIGLGTRELREECAFVARSWYGDQGSSDIADVAPVNASGQGVEAECWLDDDTDFDFGQVSGGKLVGRSTFELRQECAFIARNRYGEQGSSGIQNVKLVPLSPSGLLQGRCWLDDDPDFDAGQVDAGLVVGRSSFALRRECAFAAEARYGAQGSSSVEDVRPVGGNVSGVSADCWIDDDPDFDFGQVSGGKLYGDSTFALRQECQFIARNRYGEQGSSGLQNIQLVP